MIEIEARFLADTTGAEKIAAALNGVEADVAKLEKASPQAAAAVRNLQQAVERHTTTTTRNSDAHESNAKSAARSGQAMLTLGRGVQDAQIGTVSLSQSINGCLNNIEAMTVALGGTAGLAGVLTLVGVGISLLLNLFQDSGNEAGKAAEKHGELADQSTRVATAARKEADSLTAATQSARHYSEALNALAESSEKANAEAQNRLKVLEATQSAELMLADAEAAASMAEIDDAVARGVMSPQDAEKRRAGVEMDSASKRHRAEQTKNAAMQNEALQRAFKARIDAVVIAGLGNLSGLVDDGLLKTQDREALTKENEAAKNRFAEASREQAEANQALGPILRTDLMRDGEDPRAFHRRMENQLKRANRDLPAERDRAQRTAAALAADKRAREQSGFGSLEEAEAAAEARKQRIADLNRTGDAAFVEASNLGMIRSARERAFGIRQGTRSLRRDGTVRELDEKDARLRNEMELKRLREEEEEKNSLKHVRSEFGDVISGARAAGANEKGIAALVKAQQGVEQGEHTAAVELSRLLQLLSAKIPRLEKEIRELRAANEQLSIGH